MKTKINLLITILALAMAGYAQNPKDDILNAWQLRLSGQADSALVILEMATTADTTCSQCWYELSRTYRHLAMGDPRQMVDYHKRSKDAMQHAIANDPGQAYYIKCKGEMESLDLYMALHEGRENVSGELMKVERTYLEALSLDPDFYPVKLSLVEFFWSIPEEMGGSQDKAGLYAESLKGSDPICGAKAAEIMLPEQSDRVGYWREIVADNPRNPGAIEALGRAFLVSNDVAQATACFEQVIHDNPAKVILYLDLGRYYMMSGPDLDSVAPLIEEAFEKYLNAGPGSPPPIKAWAVGMLAQIKYRTGDAEEGALLMAEAMALDPFFSRAFGLPDPALYCHPEEKPVETGYFFRPF